MNLGETKGLNSKIVDHRIVFNNFFNEDHGKDKVFYFDDHNLFVFVRNKRILVHFRINEKDVRVKIYRFRDHLKVINNGCFDFNVDIFHINGTVGLLDLRFSFHSFLIFFNNKGIKKNNLSFGFDDVLNIFRYHLFVFYKNIY